MKHLTGQSLLLFIALLSAPRSTLATPFPVQFNSKVLLPRSCAYPCGFYGQICCAASETCATNDESGQAECAPEVEPRQNSGGGQWEYFTTTFVQTDYVTVTSTGSRLITSPTSQSNAKCKASLGESPCGSICCTAAQACQSPGQCVESGSSPIETPPVEPSNTAQPSGTVPAGTATPTVPFIPPVGPSGTGTAAPITGGGGLSGGAIAGIVIGTLAGVFILLLLCACFCVGSFFDRIRSILGMGRTRSSSYTGSTSYGSRSSRHGRTWFGMGGGRHSSRSSRSDRRQGLFGMGRGKTIGLIIGAIAVALGLKKRHDRRSEKSGSYGPGSSYYYGSQSRTSSSSSSSSSGRGSRSRSRSRSRRS